jgi:hypothetical protein
LHAIDDAPGLLPGLIPLRLAPAPLDAAQPAAGRSIDAADLSRIIIGLPGRRLRAKDRDRNYHNGERGRQSTKYHHSSPANPVVLKRAIMIHLNGGAEKTIPAFAGDLARITRPGDCPTRSLL